MPHEFSERLQSVTAAIKALQEDMRGAAIPNTLQARVDSIRSELEAMNAEWASGDHQNKPIDNSSANREQQPFLFRVMDALRPLTNAVEIQETVTRMVMEAYQADRCYYCEIEKSTAIIRRDASREGLPSVAGSYPLESLPIFKAVVDAGRPIIVSDVTTADTVDEALRELCIQLKVIAYIDIPVMKQEQCTGILCIVQASARNWTESEIQLAVEIAERTWSTVERGRAERALRESETKYRTLFETTTEGLCIIEMIYDDDGKAVDLRYLEVNPVFEQQTGLKSAVGRLASELVPGTERYWIENYECVVRTGIPLHFENYHEATGRWYSASATRIGSADNPQVAILFTDITERKRLEQQQAYLLKLSDALRPLSDAVAIQRVAMNIIGEHLQADRVMYIEFDFKNQHYTIAENYVRSGFPKRVGQFPISTFSSLIEWFKDGRTSIINDVRQTPLLTDTEKEEAIAARVLSVIGIPLFKDGRLVAHLGIQQGHPHDWTAEEIELARETAERTWAAVQRAYAEAAELEQRMLAEALRDTAVALSSTLQMEEVLEVALDSANRIVPFDGGLIVLTEKGKVIQFHTQGLEANEQAVIERWHLKKANLHTSALYRMAASRQEPVLLKSEKLRSLRLPAAFGSAVLIKPLLHQDSVIGYFTLISRETARFSESDFLKLRALAYQVVIAIQSANRFQQAQELAVLQERNKIARELHDAVTQTLFSASIISESLVKQLVQRDTDDMTNMLSSVHRLVQSAMAEMRTLLLELRPMHVYSTPFQELLRQLVQAVMGRKRIDASIRFEGNPRLPEEVHFAFYRIAQEAINNIVKHANAAQFTISGQGGDHFIDLRIHDNGEGFDSDGTSGGMGLSTMRERAAEVGARLTVHSIVGDGTEIRVVWPKDGNG